MNIAIVTALVACCLLEAATANPFMKSRTNTLYPVETRLQNIARMQQGGDISDYTPDYMFSVIDSDAQLGLCGCWIQGNQYFPKPTEPSLPVVPEPRIQENQNMDFSILKARVQQEGLPYRFHVVDVFGTHSVCLCSRADISGE